MSPIIKSTREQLRPTDVNRLANILADGGIAIVPVDTVYGLIGKAFDQSVFERLDSIKGDRRLPYPAIFGSIDTIEEWFGGVGYRQRRLMSGLMPGPLTVVLDAKGKIPAEFRYRHSGIGVRVSSDALLPQLVEKLGSPIWATSANRSNDTTPADFRAINHNVVQAVDIAVDSGPTMFHDASTVVDLRTAPYKILREGPWLNRVLKAISHSNDPLTVVTVCSGNICRSPIAAFLLEAQNIPNIKVTSAGINAFPGQAATLDMIDIAAKWGVDLSTHRSQPATVELLRSADIILAATPHHLQEIIRIEPRARRKTFLITEPIGQPEVPDPYEQGGDMYRRVAELIRRSMEGWAERIRKIALEEFTIPQTFDKIAEKEPDQVG